MATTIPLSIPRTDGRTSDTITGNIALAQRETAGMDAAQKMIWFFDKVKTGGDFDYKNKDGYGGDTPTTQDFGNTNFGAVGTAIGIPSIILDIGAGAAQIASDLKDGKSPNSPLSDYGDNPGDQAKIENGKDWAVENGYENPVTIPDQVAVDYFKELLKTRDLGAAAIALALKYGWELAKRFLFPRDPIILDLDGNGIKTVGLAANIHFDYDNDGVLTQTGWVGNGDALLVLDRNTNGNIDNGTELFGDYTPITRTNADGSTTTTYAPNGFAALASLDSNNDGIIDANDPAFAQLKLWRDTNQNGTTNMGELITLQEAGIVSLNLANVLKNQATGNGNTLTREGSFTKLVTTLDSATGQTTTQTVTQTMGEYNLAINTFDTQFKENITISDTVKTLPNMHACTGMFLSSGSGNVRELQQAANDDEWSEVA